MKSLAKICLVKSIISTASFFREMWFIIDWPYKQNIPSIVRIIMTFSGPSEQLLVRVNLKSVAPSWQISSLPNVHVILFIEGDLRIPKGTWPTQLESPKNESAVMLHSEGEEHVTTLTSVSLGIGCLRMSSTNPAGKPGTLWTAKRSMLLEQLLPSVVKFSQRMVLL